MKIKTKLLPILFGIFIIALIFVPTLLIFELSQAEMQEYAAPETPVLREASYGAPVMAERIDIYESITVSGVFVSEQWTDMELEYLHPELIRWNISVGDQVVEGQVIGTYQGKEILSSVTGIVQEINSYNSQNSYIRVSLTKPVLLECDLTQEQLSDIQKTDALTLKDGTSLSLEYVSLLRNADDTTTVRLSIDAERYQLGQTVTDLVIYTGVSFPQTLVLPEECVYQKNNDETWYARKVTEDGLFITEITLQVNGNYDGMVRVSGVEAGDWFDSGYKSIMGNKNG